jgi:hypothetical protein
MTTKASAFSRLKQHLGDTDPALEVMPAEKGLHRFEFSGTWNIDYRITCWCQKSHRLNTLGWRLMTEGLNRWMAEHEMCEPREV